MLKYSSQTWTAFAEAIKITLCRGLLFLFIRTASDLSSTFFKSPTLFTKFDATEFHTLRRHLLNLTRPHALYLNNTVHDSSRNNNNNDNNKCCSPSSLHNLPYVHFIKCSTSEPRTGFISHTPNLNIQPITICLISPPQHTGHLSVCLSCMSVCLSVCLTSNFGSQCLHFVFGTDCGRLPLWIATSLTDASRTFSQSLLRNAWGLFYNTALLLCHECFTIYNSQSIEHVAAQKRLVKPK